MFATIETKGASHIAIYIPHEGADKSLPALAALLERNAVFVSKGWQEFKVVKPEMAITLGDKFEVTDGDQELVISASDAVLGDDFALATPAQFISNRRGLEKAKAENTRLSDENRHLKNELESLKARIAELTTTEDEA